MKEYMMALDQGTTSSRCILFDKKGQIRAKAQKEYGQIYPRSGWVEHNPKEIWSSQYAVMAEALAMLSDGESVAAIGITNQRETTIVWDKETGEPVCNAIVWQCRRTAEQIDLLKKDQLLPLIAFYAEKYDFAEVVPVSAFTGENKKDLLDALYRKLPEGPRYYPEDAISDLPENMLIGELIREQAERFRQGK